MSPFLALFLVLVLGATSYAAGRLHGQLSYRIGYRFGYRQGYFDGDRGAWNRRRRDAQAVLASALAAPAVPSSAGTTAGVTAGPTATRVGVAAAPVGAGLPPHRPQPSHPADAAGPSAPTSRQGTTYTGSSFAATPGPIAGRHPTGTLVRRPG
ncbi:hypothetical protein ACIG87_17975 [Micromonospora sp. NPDC051925]|uniref:hypothetical protein n=1 Tax=Micromonospora sp. NPDC051925 TaxID=3364288 RepID=UPI0037C5626A